MKLLKRKLKKVPIMLIAGEKEEKDGSVSLRRRHSGDLGIRMIDELIPEIVGEIKTRRRV